MRVAVDTRFLQNEKMPALQSFAKEVVERMVKLHTEHQFIFFFDDASNGFAGFAANVSVITITPRPKNMLMYKWWYDIKLPLALKKCKADVFIALNGLCSLHTSVPQVLVIHDLAFLHQKLSNTADYPRTYYQQNTFDFIKKAAAIAVPSDFINQELRVNYKTGEKTIYTVASAAGSLFKPVDWQQKEEIKQQYAAGCEYFVFTAGLYPGSNLVNVLKAFSIFKKWQKTNMKLVIAATLSNHEMKQDKFNSYKYRDDVFFTDNLSDTVLSSVIAGSYALISLLLYEGFGMPVLQAMQCEVPAITTSNSAMSEIAGEAALYADPAKPEEIAEQMKKIFKDEQLRNKLIEEGKQRTHLFTWDKTAALLWQLAEQAVSK